MKLVVKPYWRREDGFAASTTAIVLASVAAVTAAAGAITAGQAQKSAANYNAQVAENNAVASQQAANAQAQLIAQKNRRLKGSQIAALSAAGLDINSDSATNVLYDSAVSGELDRLTAIYSGKVNSENYKSQAAMSRKEGSNAALSGYIGAGTSLLGGVARGYALSNATKANPSFDGVDYAGG